MINIQPMNKRVLVKKLEAANPHGFSLPDDPNNTKATIEAISNTCTNFEVGDHVLILKYAGVEIRVNNYIHFLIKEKDIIGKIINND